MAFCTPLGALAAAAMSVSTGSISLDLGGGWEAEWDVELEDVLILTVNGLTEEGVFIDKTAFFKPDTFEGGLPREITFRQTSFDAVPYIVIQEETIYNWTETAWTGFEMTLDGADREVRFDVEQTLTSGGPGPLGWRVDPFESASFTDSDRDMTLSGGIVDHGQVWQPGLDPLGGSLWIHAAPRSSGQFQEFTLTETPLALVPAPGALVLLGLGALVGRWRRRRE